MLALKRRHGFQIFQKREAGVSVLESLNAMPLREITSANWLIIASLSFRRLVLDSQGLCRDSLITWGG